MDGLAKALVAQVLVELAFHRLHHSIVALTPRLEPTLLTALSVDVADHHRLHELDQAKFTQL